MTKGGRRLLGFCRVWPEEMEKRSVVARGRWSCRRGGRRNKPLWGWSSVSVGGGRRCWWLRKEPMGRLGERRTRGEDGGWFRSCEEQREQLRGRICGGGS